MLISETWYKTRVRQYQGSRSSSWRVDETYVRVGGKWKYLFRAVDKFGQLIASMQAERRDTEVAYRVPLQLLT
jgi:transposase, IS6 family